MWVVGGALVRSWMAVLVLTLGLVANHSTLREEEEADREGNDNMDPAGMGDTWGTESDPVAPRKTVAD